MVEQLREAIHRLGTRADAMGNCPICGGPVNSRQDRVRIWHRTYAHGSCASYRRRADSYGIAAVNGGPQHRHRL